MYMYTFFAAAVAVDRLAVVGLAEHFVVLESELLAGGQLALAALARKTRQMIDVVLGAPHPVARLNVARAFGALGAEVSFHKQSNQFLTLVLCIRE